jgi:hypothetical protein
VLEHVRWVPGIECVATWRLTLEPSAATTLGVIAVDPGGVRHRLFSADTELPGLAAATDPEVMRPWFAERLGRPVDSCTITPVRYQPGSRCVLRYDLCGRVPAAVYGKLLAGDGFEALASVVIALGGHLAPAAVGVAPDWRLVAQADAGGRSLRSVVVDPPSRSALSELRAGGRLLSRLHARHGPPGRHRSLAEDAEELRQHLPAAAVVSPLIAGPLAEGIDRLAGLAGPMGQAVPSHGAFRLDQVHLSAAGAVLIDLDSYCWAEPARDLGNLLAYLRWREIRQPGAARAVAGIRAGVLAGYAAEAPAPLDAGRIATFEAAAALKIGGRRCQRLAVDEWDRVPELLEAALGLLGAGAGARRAW